MKKGFSLKSQFCSDKNSTCSNIGGLGSLKEIMKFIGLQMTQGSANNREPTNGFLTLNENEDLRQCLMLDSKEV